MHVAADLQHHCVPKSSSESSSNATDTAVIIVSQSTIRFLRSSSAGRTWTLLLDFLDFSNHIIVPQWFEKEGTEQFDW